MRTETTFSPAATALLASLKGRGWEVLEDSLEDETRIRRVVTRGKHVEDEVCPVCDAVNRQLHRTQWFSAAFPAFGSGDALHRTWGLEYADVEDIVHAADWTADPRRPELMRLLGVEEVAQ